MSSLKFCLWKEISLLHLQFLKHTVPGYSKTFLFETPSLGDGVRVIDYFTHCLLDSIVLNERFSINFIGGCLHCKR